MTAIRSTELFPATNKMIISRYFIVPDITYSYRTNRCKRQSIRRRNYYRSRRNWMVLNR
jgi:hypothetical protein